MDSVAVRLATVVEGPAGGCVGRCDYLQGWASSARAEGCTDEQLRAWHDRYVGLLSDGTVKSLLDAIHLSLSGSWEAPDMQDSVEDAVRFVAQHNFPDPAVVHGLFAALVDLEGIGYERGKRTAQWEAPTP